MFLQDFFENSTENHHKNMSHIRSKDTKPEKQIRSALWKAGFRYRICDKRYSENLILFSLDTMLLYL